MKTIIPLKKKSPCSAFKDNFLYAFLEQNSFVFDNHRLSLWSYMANVSKGAYGKYSLICIDQHVDCRCVSFDERYEKFISNLEDIKYIERFQGLFMDSPNNKLPVVDAGNFLAFSLKLEIFKDISILTRDNEAERHLENELSTIRTNKFRIDNINMFNLDLVEKLKESFDLVEQVVLDIDLDMFIYENNGTFVIDNEQLSEFLEIIKENKSKIVFSNIALSPDYCAGRDDFYNGWKNSEEVLKKFVDMFGLDVIIPLQEYKDK